MQACTCLGLTALLYAQMWLCVSVCACGSEGQSESAVAPAPWAVKPTLYPLPFSSLDLI